MSPSCTPRWPGGSYASPAGCWPISIGPSVERIDSHKDESLYWIATLISNTLGTSTGDYLAHENSGLHAEYITSAVIISAALLILLGAHYLTPISGTLIFWAAYVLTHPLGANAGNTLSKAQDQGGLASAPTEPPPCCSAFW
jgi:uncharacterized membrane-anchored protein